MAREVDLRLLRGSSLSQFSWETKKVLPPSLVHAGVKVLTTAGSVKVQPHGFTASQVAHIRRAVLGEVCSLLLDFSHLKQMG